MLQLLKLLSSNVLTKTLLQTHLRVDYAVPALVSALLDPCHLHSSQRHESGPGHGVIAMNGCLRTAGVACTPFACNICSLTAMGLQHENLETVLL